MTSASRAITANCMCGAITVTAAHASQAVEACHCHMCRQWGGGPLLVVDCGAEVSFEDEAKLAVYHSSEWADRGFCSVCGTHLFYRFRQENQYMLPAGLLGENSEFQFVRQVFVDQKPAWYCFANQTLELTAEQAVAEYLDNK